MGVASSKGEDIAQSTTILILKEPDLTNIPIENTISTLIVSNKHITELPSNLSKVTSTVLSFNNYQLIPNTIINSLSKYSLLKNLDFSHNFLESIDSKIFELNNITRFHFSQNNISNLPDSIQFPHVKHFNISLNKITEIPKCFPGIASLIADHNYIQSIDYSFDSITRLVLNHNSISRISSNISFPSLFLLDLSYNKLNELPDLSLFAPTLKTFDASYNEITVIPKLPESIIRLYLQHNKIHHIKNFFMSNVVLANLSFNEIETLDDLPGFLERLDISHNKIHTVAPIISENIAWINFSNNFIESIPSTTIPEQLFSFNRISQLPKCFFNSITLLDLSGNNLEELPSAIFTSESLVTLFAGFNNIKTLPIEAQTSKIRKLNLSFNSLSENIIFPLNIESLYIDYCNLSTIPSINVDYQELVELSAVGNHLKSIDTLIPKQIQFINVSGNQIESICLSTAVIYKDLRYLDLSFNFIRNINDCFLNSQFPSLFYLDFSSNPIGTLIDETIFVNMPKLSFLIMDNLQIINQTLTLSNLTNLRYLNTSLPNENSSEKVRVSSSKCLNKNVSYSNYIGLNEKDENYICNIDFNGCSTYSLFKDYKTMILASKMIQNEIENGVSIESIKSLIPIISQNKQLYSPFIFLLENFDDSNKFVALIYGKFQLISISKTGEIVEINEQASIDELLDNSIQIVEFCIPTDTKYLVITETTSLELIPSEFLSVLSSKTNNSCEFALSFKTVISFFDRIHNFSSIVIDISQKHVNK